MLTQKIATRVNEVPFSGIRRVVEKAVRLEEQGRKVIRFDSGRPDFDTPQHIKEAAKKALDEGFVHYAPNRGTPGLRRAVSASIAQLRKIEYAPESEILVTAGAQEAVMLSLQALLNPGEEVLVPNPGYSLNFSCVLLAGGVPKTYDLAPPGFGWDEAAAARQVTGKTKALLVNSPHNPTGAVLSPEEIASIAGFARRHDLLVLSDEAYDRILYDGAGHYSVAAQPGMKERTLLIGSLSKSYSMTGWRVGYVAAPPEFINAMIKVQQNAMISVCSFAQKGAEAALSGSQECVAGMVAEFARRRDVVLKAIREVPGLACPESPRGAFYFFIDHRELGLTSMALCDHLLDRAGVATVPGSDFGPAGEGYLRLSYATSYENCVEGMARIKDTLAAL